MHSMNTVIDTKVFDFNPNIKHYNPFFNSTTFKVSIFLLAGSDFRQELVRSINWVLTSKQCCPR